MLEADLPRKPVNAARQGREGLDDIQIGQLEALPRWLGEHQPMTLAQLLIPLAILFSVSLVFFGMNGGYYDTDAYDGNGTAH